MTEITGTLSCSSSSPSSSSIIASVCPSWTVCTPSSLLIQRKGSSFYTEPVLTISKFLHFSPRQSLDTLRFLLQYIEPLGDLIPQPCFIEPVHELELATMCTPPTN